VSAATAGELYVHAYAVAFLLDCLIERGELTEALELVEAPAFAGELPDLFGFHLLRVARARTRIASGNAEAGVRELIEVGRSMALGQFSPSVCPWRGRTAVGLVALGRHEEARALAEEELRLARTTDAVWAEVVALGALALAAPETAADALQRAIELSDRYGFALEHARALILLGALRRRQGQRKVATELLREGLDRSAHCGALALEERAHAELTAAGLRPRRRSLTGVDSLTTGERRVAELAADGLSNREIAQALFVSMRTVETHLTHTYQKLGIRSRSELAAALRDPIGSRP
jgi:ATP/maltotriose-dependent transcriptional regulator MalT